MGRNREGWWTCEDLEKQLKETIIPLFDQLHPNCTGLFAFDQSSNHRAYANNALVASRMSSGEVMFTEKTIYRFRDTSFVDNLGETKPQKIYVVRSFDRRKVIAERTRSGLYDGTATDAFMAKHSYSEVNIYIKIF